MTILFSLLFSASTLIGSVHDPAGQPIAGASVACTDHVAITDAAGAFTIDVPDEYVLRVSHPGFQTRTATTPDVTLQPAFSETMVVSGIRADAETPVTKT
ncbi:MAG TPA: carboxypeptidase-like regulatory domain-containing protein, partial [Thermoanaerobaculia bacterium]|nr:carboxypeptidase-like regulatory domain-containing protein [Thermoanaerobaculia bacterium]